MKKLHLCAVITLYLLVAGCATAPQGVGKTAATTDPEVTETAELPATPFAIDTLYDLLVGDIALTRSQFDIALPKYLQQARQTRDAGIVEMASRVASHLRDHEASLEMALLWVEIDSENPQSQSAALQAYAIEGDAINALTYASWLYQNYDDLEAFLAVTSIYEGATYKEINHDEKSALISALIAAYQQLQLPPEKQASVLLARAILHRDSAQLAESERLAKEFLVATPDDQRGLLLLAQVLHQLNRIDEAVLLIEDSLKRKPDDRKLRLQYARFLTITDRNLAISQFEILRSQDPKDQEVNFLLALLQLNQGQIEQAVALFKEAAGKPSLSADAHYHLGSIADRQGNVSAALGHYRQVRFGRNYLAAASRPCRC